MSITENIKKVNESLAENVTLVAVSKTKPNEAIIEAYHTGQRIFGENKVQELVKKYEELPKDIQWHMIGHLQSNKVKMIAPFVSLIHGVDKPKLLREINKRALENNRVINCLLQVHIAEESTKFGFSTEELFTLFNEGILAELKNVNIIGLMGMATYTEDENQICAEFKKLKKIFDQIKSNYFTDNAEFKELSMGMSGDYALAIEEGSTMVRIGSTIFGERNY